MKFYDSDDSASLLSTSKITINSCLNDVQSCKIYTNLSINMVHKHHISFHEQHPATIYANWLQNGKQVVGLTYI